VDYLFFDLCLSATQCTDFQKFKKLIFCCFSHRVECISYGCCAVPVKYRLNCSIIFIINDYGSETGVRLIIIIICICGIR
jgi:hypothetical protein